jgi:hypothetical protein
MTDPVVKTLDQIILLYVLVSSFEFSSINLVLNATYRLNGLAVLKPWRRHLGEYIKKEKQQ